MDLSAKMEKIMILKTEINSLERKKEQLENVPGQQENKGFLSGFLGGNRASVSRKATQTLTKEENIKLEHFKKQYYSLLTEDCIYCGDLMIQNIRFKFDVDDYDKHSWMIF